MDPIFALRIDQTAFATYALCSALLALKMLGSAVYTASQRGRVGGYVNPEDTRFGTGEVEASEVEKPQVARALRMQRNDLENIPMFWVVGLLYVLGGASALGAALFTAGPTRSRASHTRWRTLAACSRRARCFGRSACCAFWACRCR